MCAEPKGSAAQQGPRFQCLTVDPPRQSSMSSLQTFGSQGNQSAVTDFAAQRLSTEYGFSAFGVASARDRWLARDGLTPSGKVTLGVGFLNGSDAEREACIRAASDWLRNGVEANLDFAWNVPVSGARIRVRFGPGGNWSMVGRNALSATDQAQPTMNIADTVDYVLKHEFGHALGLRHEHQHPGGAIQWNEAFVIAAMSAQNPPWTAAYTRANIFSRFDQDTKCIGDPDPNYSSLMMYPVPSEWTLNGFSATPATIITDRDLRCVRGLYSL
jgi:hypothetical protein